jgi:hypothetical protein
MRFAEPNLSELELLAGQCEVVAVLPAEEAKPGFFVLGLRPPLFPLSVVWFSRVVVVQVPAGQHRRSEHCDGGRKPTWWLS